MSALNDTLNEVMGLPLEEKVGLASAAYVKLLPTLRQMDGEGQGMTLLCTILCTAAGADGRLTAAETALIQAILRVEGMNTNLDDILALVRAAADKGGMVRALTGGLKDEDKNALLVLTAAVCAIDERIVPEEVAYITSLL